MRKSDKKIENNLRLALTEVCELTLKEVEGFQWLTHRVNYANFPKSLRVICVFDSNDNLADFLAGNKKETLVDLIKIKLRGIDVPLFDVTTQISFDTEENCELNHHGNWAKRLQ